MVHVEEDVIIRTVRSLRVAHLYRALAEKSIIIGIVRPLRAAHLYRSLLKFP